MNELIRLPDGGTFLVRPMERRDAAAVRAGFAALSPGSLRSRFFTPVPRLTEGVLADLTAVEPGRKIVLLAFTSDRGELAGGARAVRDRVDPTRADIAVTVADAFQGRGLGTALLRELRHEARLQGVEHFGGHVLVDNDAARRLLTAAGGRLAFDEPGVLRFDLELGAARQNYRRLLPPVGVVA
jgi:GNAT superfamily N-acetyltransferase